MPVSHLAPYRLTAPAPFAPPSGAYWNGTVRVPATNSVANVQAAIDACSDRDVVRLNAGSNQAWASQLTISAGILLDLNGNTITKGNGDSALISITVGSVSTRVTNGSLHAGSGDSGNGSAGWYGARYFGIGGSSDYSNAPFRIDNIDFGAISTNQIFIDVGTVQGCIDSNTMTGDGAAEIIHSLGWGDGDTTGWTTTVTPGSSAMVFIEDNEDTNTESTYFYGHSFIQSYYGARTVARFNTLNNAHIDQHGTAGQVGARWFEIYGNTFNVNVNQSDCIVIRAGSGVIYDNVLNNLSGASGGRNLGMYEEDAGSHLERYQPGAGYNATSVGNGQQSPIYLWNNTGGFGYAPDGGLVQNNRDVFTSSSKPDPQLILQKAGDTTSTTYTYSPYTYPHPVRALT